MKTLPHCDISTGKIYGCKKGSKDYYHEHAHLVFNDSQLGSTLKLWQGYAIDFWMITTTLTFLDKFMIWLVVPLMLFSVGAEVYEERWCNKYADKMLTQKTKKHKV